MIEVRSSTGDLALAMVDRAATVKAAPSSVFDHRKGMMEGWAERFLGSVT
jgi:hypothetical protein